MAASNSSMRAFIWGCILDDWRNIILSLIMFIALCFCLYQPFVTRRKNIAEKTLMLGVAVIVNGGTGILAGNYMLEHTVGWLVIFPIWNIVNGLILLAMFRYKIVDYRSISDRDTNTAEIILGAVVILLILIICNFVYKMYWAVTLSLCVVYATSLSKAFQKAFPGKQRIVISQPSESKVSQ